MDVQIPLYRAKKIDSDEYVDGLLDKRLDNTLWISDFRTMNDDYQIDPLTLAIHFPDMLDSEGNKIFASLSEDGKGGDIVHKNGVGFYKDIDERGVVIHKNGNCYIKYKEDKELLSLQVFHSGKGVISSLRVIGIQK